MAGAPSGNGAGNNWMLNLPPEYHDDKSLGKFKDLGSFAKGYKDLEGFLSTSTRLPKQDSPKEDWDKFYSGWGRPGKAEEYKFPDGLPQEFAPPDDLKKSLHEAAYSAGLNQKQFEGLVAWGVMESKRILEAEGVAKEAAAKELRDKWSFRYEANRDRAVRTIATLANMNKEHPFIKWLESTGNDTNPAVLQFFYEVSEGLGEDNLVTETARKEATEATSAQKRINEIMADINGPYFKENDPRHSDAVAEVTKLYQVLNPE